MKASVRHSNPLAWLPLTNGFEYHLAQNDEGLPSGMGRGAVKFVYTSLTNGNAFEYLTNTASRNDTRQPLQEACQRKKRWRPSRQK
jgi:hypothetical protein